MAKLYKKISIIVAIAVSFCFSATNDTTIDSAVLKRIYMGNYSYNTCIASQPILSMRWASDLNRPVFKNRTGTLYKALLDASTTSNTPQYRVFFADGNGLASSSSVYTYTSGNLHAPYFTGDSVVVTGKLKGATSTLSGNLTSSSITSGICNLDSVQANVYSGSRLRINGIARFVSSSGNDFNFLASGDGYGGAGTIFSINADADSSGNYFFFKANADVNGSSKTVAALTANGSFGVSRKLTSLYRIGAGTDNPSYPLHVVGRSYFSSSDGSDYTFHALGDGYGGAANVFTISADADSSGNFTFLKAIADVNGTPKTVLTITSNGSIGTTGNITSKKITSSDSVKAIDISATGRITGTDIDVSDSVKAGSSRFSTVHSRFDIHVDSGAISTGAFALNRSWTLTGQAVNTATGKNQFMIERPNTTIRPFRIDSLCYDSALVITYDTTKVKQIKVQKTVDSDTIKSNISKSTKQIVLNALDTLTFSNSEVRHINVDTLTSNNMEWIVTGGGSAVVYLEGTIGTIIYVRMTITGSITMANTDFFGYGNIQAGQYRMYIIAGNNQIMTFKGGN